MPEPLISGDSSVFYRDPPKLYRFVTGLGAYDIPTAAVTVVAEAVKRAGPEFLNRGDAAGTLPPVRGGGSARRVCAHELGTAAGDGSRDRLGRAGPRCVPPARIRRAIAGSGRTGRPARVEI